MALRSRNPVLRDKFFQNLPATAEPMTLNGTLVRTGLLLVLMLITGAWTWRRFMLATAAGAPFSIAIGTRRTSSGAAGIVRNAFGSRAVIRASIWRAAWSSCARP